MKRRINNIKKKAKAIKQILDYDSFDLSTALSPEDELKVILGQELKNLFNPKNIQEKQYIENAIDRTTSKVFSKKSKEQSFFEVTDQLMGQRMWYFSLVSGFASIWELKVKLLASRYGVEIKKPYELRNKKQQKFKITVYRELSQIIEDFQKSSNNVFKLNLRQVADIRSSLIHANFDQLRILFNDCKKVLKKEHRGNVVVFNPSNPGEKVQNLSDINDSETKEAQDIFGWFIEGTNSTLLEDVWNMLSESIANINTLIEFKAISFDERSEVFEKIMTGKYKLTEADIEMYQEYFTTSQTQHETDVKLFFKNLNKLFVKDIYVFKK